MPSALTLWRTLAFGWALALFIPLHAHAANVEEYHLKAVFVFNFTLFVQWPSEAFSSPEAPLIIGVVGEDPFGAALDEAVRNEKAGGRPVLVERHRRIEDLTSCHVLFVSRSEQSRLDKIIRALGTRPVLTVSDIDDFTARGGMVHLINENKRVRLRVNPGAAKSAGLVLSSKLLRAAEIVASTKD